MTTPTRGLNRKLLIVAGLLIVGGLGVMTGQGLAHPAGAWANGWLEDDCSGLCLWLFGLWCGATLAHKHIIKPLHAYHAEQMEAHAKHAERLDRLERE